MPYQQLAIAQLVITSWLQVLAIMLTLELLPVMLTCKHHVVAGMAAGSAAGHEEPASAAAAAADPPRGIRA